MNAKICLLLDSLELVQGVYDKLDKISPNYGLVVLAESFLSNYRRCTKLYREVNPQFKLTEMPEQDVDYLLNQAERFFATLRLYFPE